jgi:hypothetical protein
LAPDPGRCAEEHEGLRGGRVGIRRTPKPALPDLDELASRKILPFVDHEHAISVAVGSASPVDVNLKLFTLIGRMAMRELWHLWFAGGGDRLPMAPDDRDCPEASDLAQQIVQLVRNNPILLTPCTDEQSVEVGGALIFPNDDGRVEPSGRQLRRCRHRAHGLRLPVPQQIPDDLRRLSVAARRSARAHVPIS